MEVPPAEIVRDLVRGYWKSHVVHLIADLGLADQIAAGTTSSDDLAAVNSLSTDVLYRTLRACVTMGLVDEGPGRTFTLTAAGEHLRSDHPKSLRSYVRAILDPAHLLPWARFPDVVRTGRTFVREALGSDMWEWYAAHPEKEALFSGAMANVTSLIAAEVPALIDLSRFKRIADIGGSHGLLLSALVEAAPHATGVLFDLPTVIEHARKTLRHERIEFVAGDFFTEVPPADCYVLKYILHDWDDEPSETILRNCYRAAEPGATLIVVDMIVPEPGTPTPAHLMDLHMLVLSGGRERTRSEFDALLGKAGFEIERVHQTSAGVSVLEARRT